MHRDQRAQPSIGLRLTRAQGPAAMTVTQPTPILAPALEMRAAPAARIAKEKVELSPPAFPPPPPVVNPDGASPLVPAASLEAGRTRNSHKHRRRRRRRLRRPAPCTVGTRSLRCLLRGNLISQAAPTQLTSPGRPGSHRPPQVPGGLQHPLRRLVRVLCDFGIFSSEFYR